LEKKNFNENMNENLNGILNINNYIDNFNKYKYKKFDDEKSYKNLFKDNQVFENIESFSIEDDKIFINCGHSFHKKCLNSWMKKSNSCPICRLEIKNCITNKIFNQPNSTRESLSNKNSYKLENLNLINDEKFIECLTKIQKSLNDFKEEENIKKENFMIINTTNFMFI
jgi:hypothetical protein